MISGLIGLSASRVNIVVNTLVASFLVEGSISFLNYSYRLMHFPLGVFAVALGTVTLPNASELAARRDMMRLGAAYHQAISLNMFLIIPSAALLAMFGLDIVQLIYEWGAFGETASRNTALALLHYSYGLIGFAAVRVTVPVFYALEDSRLPTVISVGSVVLNMALYYPMVKMLNFAGLAAATSIAGLVNFGFLLYFLPRKGVPVNYAALFLNFFRMALAALLAIYVARMIPVTFFENLSEVVTRLLSLGVRALAACLLYLLSCYLLRVREVSALTDRVFHRRSG